MNTDLSLMHLAWEASFFVQVVMLLLVAMSVASWWVIFKKRLVLTQAQRAADQFEDDFWSGADLSSLYARIDQETADPRGMEAIFWSGFREFLRLRSQLTVDSSGVVNGAQRAMRAAVTRELDELETHLPLLATTGSTSPYIGLFGTVWGIMNSFRALSNVQQATLVQVAPGIAEALITTAIGLFAAIPAVIAYNHYATGIDRLANRYDNFMEEFSNILQRQSYSVLKKAAPRPDRAAGELREQTP